MFLKVASEARMDPPIHVDRILSGGAQILMRVSLGASRRTSDSRRSPNPSKSVEPPASVRTVEDLIAWLARQGEIQRAAEAVQVAAGADGSGVQRAIRTHSRSDAPLLFAAAEGV